MVRYNENFEKLQKTWRIITPNQKKLCSLEANSKERRGSSRLLHNNGLALIHHPTMSASGLLSLQRSLSPHLLELIDFAAEPAWRSCYWTVDFLRAAYWLRGCSPLNPCSYWIGSIDTWRRNSIRSNSTTPHPHTDTWINLLCASTFAAMLYDVRSASCVLRVIQQALCPGRRKAYVRRL